MQGFFRHLTVSCSLIIPITLLANLAVLGQPGVLSAHENVAASIKTAPATHKQVKAVSVADAKAGAKLEDFCIDSKGRIVALLGPADENEFGDESVLGVAARLFGGTKKKAPKFASAVHIFDPEGKLVEKWAVGFPGQAINTAPDGAILVGGEGRVARFDVHGKKLFEAESPQMTYIAKNPEEMRERAKEQLESDKAMYAEQVKQFEDQLKELQQAKKDEKNDPKAEKRSRKPKTEDAEEQPQIQFDEQNLKLFVEAYRNQVKELEKKTVDDVVKEVVDRASRIHSITASKDNIFVTCPALAGYGYGVWRTDEKFGQAKEIVKSLSGCCGQMDVQCRNGELYVCENSRHRVVRYDREGKEIASFGKRDREGEGENFGGCCNPMNLCFNKDGNLYVSESNGVVKHFTPEGKYLGIVGVAEVQPGCKNSCVAVTADDSRLFYIDIEKSKIIVLSRDERQGAK